MMAVGLIVAIASLGSAIDAGRMYIVKSQLQAGVDAAALAGARAFGVTDTSPNGRDAQVNAYFDGNFSRTPGYMGSTNIRVVPTFAVVNGYNVTTVTASATIAMSFMKVFGFRNATMSASAKAELLPRPLEVMLVLDNTGSMRFNLSGGKTRMTALKAAANSFIDILFQGNNARPNLGVGIVNYDITANVGNLLLARRPGSVATLDGFNSSDVVAQGSWPTNTYAWKGCVMNDSTVKDVSADRLVSEAGAWDLTRTLPGEGGNPPVQPYFVPPMYVPALRATSVTAAKTADPLSDYYDKTTLEPGNNLFRFDQTSGGANFAKTRINSAAYRSWFYDYYIGLNDNAAGAGNDVIRLPDNSYYNPTSGTRTSTNWYVDWSQLPRLNALDYWSLLPETSIVNALGGSVDNYALNQTPARSPNWQCPEEALPIAYNRAKGVYTDYIRDKIGAIYPGNGTIHQSGLLWGYRLLVRDDVFTRPRPSGTTTEPARRAIVFMTDGVNDIGAYQNEYLSRTFTWYGRFNDKTISTDALQAEEQMLRRFEKTCANIQRDTDSTHTDPPQVYIISLLSNTPRINTAFNACAPGRVYQTSSVAELTRAFQDVASELIDLHLIQ